MKTLAIAAILCLPLVVLQEPSPTPGERAGKIQKKGSEGNQKPQTNQCGTNESPCVVKVIPPEANAKNAANEAAKENEHATNEKLTAYSTVVLAIITFLLAVFTALLWSITRRLVIDAKDSGVQAIKIAQDTAQAALWNARAVITSQRPFVIIGIKPEDDTLFRFFALSQGPTPAHIVCYYVEEMLIDDPFSFPIPPKYGKEIVPQLKILVPGNVPDGRELTLKKYQTCNIEETGKISVIYFRIVYRDFVTVTDKKLPDYETRTCFLYRPGMRAPIIDGPYEYNEHK